MRCPHCDKTVNMFDKMLNKNQIRTLNLCEDKPRYMYELKKLIPVDHSSNMVSIINSLVRRGLLIEVEYEFESEDDRSWKRKYYKTLKS